MIDLKTRSVEDYEYLYPIVKEYEPFCSNISFEEMCKIFDTGEGWTVVDGNGEGGRVIGYVGLSLFRPLHSVNIHAVVIPEYHGKWMNRRLMRKVFEYLFSPDKLDLVKVYSYAIYGMSYQPAKALDMAGFKVEGIDRKGWYDPASNCYFDVVNYGMLKEDCKWIRNMPVPVPVSNWLNLTRKLKGMRSA